MATLNSTQRASVQNAVSRSDAQVIKDTLLSSRGFLDNNNWLHPNNKYLKDTIGKIKNDLDVNITNKNLNPSQIKEYVAASSILHCKDGWGFLTDSISSLLEGNISSAIHIAYYAELRAAMSFLASDGIGVFNKQHIWFDNTGACNKVTNIGTHDFVWNTIEEWANVQHKSHVILQSLQIRNHSIFDWLVKAGMSPSISTATTLSKDWLKKWSVDLQILGDDHNLRNEVSYRPQEIKRSLSFDVNGINNLKFIINQWLISEPTGSEKFKLLDQFLLRQSLYNYYKTQHSREPGIRDIRNIMSGLSLSGNTSLENFLLKREHSILNDVFKNASKKAINTNGEYQPLAVISRAFLLLRLSTSRLEESLKYAGYDKLKLGFWWKDLGKKNCLWESSNEPESAQDLWADVEILIEDLNAYILSNPTAENSTLHKDISRELLESKKFQKAYLWGIGI
jgi:hypothetical protein